MENMYLIPGGRWLLVLTMDSVTLWDLDPDMLGEPTATVQEFDESYERSYMIVDATDAPTSANLLIVSMDG